MNTSCMVLWFSNYVIIFSILLVTSSMFSVICNRLDIWILCNDELVFKLMDFLSPVSSLLSSCYNLSAALYLVEYDLSLPF